MKPGGPTERRLVQTLARRHATDNPGQSEPLADDNGEQSVHPDRCRDLRARIEEMRENLASVEKMIREAKLKEDELKQEFDAVSEIKRQLKRENGGRIRQRLMLRGPLSNRLEAVLSSGTSALRAAFEVGQEIAKEWHAAKRDVHRLQFYENDAQESLAEAIEKARNNGC